MHKNQVRNPNAANGSRIRSIDALIVGGGFSGIYQLHKLRSLGYKVLLVDAGSNYGGVWHSHQYPGLRVDTETPLYQFSDPDLWQDWTWRQRFPNGAEIRAYFDYVAEKWDLRRDTEFNAFVQAAAWDEEEGKWTVSTRDGRRYKTRYFLPCLGHSAKRYIPDWKGIDSFKGALLHPSDWRQTQPDLSGKNIAIIGTAATGVQLAQALSKTASHLTIFQRTPNTALPLPNVDYESPSKRPSSAATRHALAARLDSFGGLNHNALPRATFDDPPEIRLATYEQLWGPDFLLAPYRDLFSNEDANREAYTFWRDKTRARIKDPKTADVLAPMAQPYAFGCKRIALESDYFDLFNEPHVKLVDLKATPIEEITERGIRTAAEEMDFDVVVCATGYDSVTGGLSQIDITGANGGTTLKEHWKDGVKTYLGMCVSGFPNMLFTYGPQAPTAFCNGPTCAELQGDWVVNLLEFMRENSLTRLQAKGESEDEWKEKIWSLANATLLPKVRSWWMGDNIPGKPREPLIYLGGVPAYYKTLNEVAADGYCGFELS
ncbi:cyclopentanone 1,2-monooxygenase [Trematosphaeria pertusa]|uniref:Cyclopentanone 1,2-monooxygenase n=1 Tax=Trematosphaeria pertusa TaxID=390896 RepID=A0A6A6J1A3_9PLEO|nr:cyclopentanone 1,2-monooxygenase [Trematosphaeria pertusa]KAF2255213.1 cyclopentanone 1,2-monooxygenase [Trematosphaeria pertusa]